MRRLNSIALFCTAAALPAGLAYAQVAQMPQAAQPTAPPAAVPAPPPVVVVLPPPLWDPRDAQELLVFIQQLGGEGLDPLDYDPVGLLAALRSGDPMVLSQVAGDRFNRVASDLALGHVRGKEREDWHIPDPDLDNGRLDQLLRVAVAEHRISDTLRSLLPTHPQYRDLKNALSITPRSELAKSNRIRLNMDRWRWLPRDLGAKYVIVNVPAYYVALVENGTTRWRQRAIAGAIRTPTPMLTATATGVILNPWWEVPKSIEPEVRGKAGYIPVKGKDGKVQRWRQPPGPSNALGHVKFVMPNSKAIFLHDTNARSRFNNDVRSLSHGCIRTQNILDLSTELLADDGGEWTREKIDETLASKKTVQASFVKPLPVYIVYFSSAAATDGRIINYTDIYKRDAKVIAALLDRQPKPASEVASR
ncbi:MAG: L,D-transpeptidase family protein [Sphingomicrobium sp.]